MNFDVLNDIPDPQNRPFDEIETWVNQRVAAIQRASFAPECTKTFGAVTLETIPPSPFGPEASTAWRRFFLATLLADWACYETPQTRVDVARLRYILTTAYPTTRVWGMTLEDGLFTPLGYTCWYPIDPLIAEAVLKNPEAIHDRGLILPLRFVESTKASHAYLMNISLAPSLRNAECVRKLTHAFQKEIASAAHLTFLAITLDPHEERLCRIGGFSSAAIIEVQGDHEQLCVRPPLK
ncbi:MAG: hypothetical protein PHS57_07705 [Alphaproteobacteria bacterium]|nr:hypothetical protein [Alphaproteobacteria bacterium]